MRPLTDSRSERVLVADGSIAYSAVTQPRPEPLRHRGTPSEAEAAQSTLVRPNSMSTDPAGCSCQPRVNRIGRSSSSARPSARVEVMRRSLVVPPDGAPGQARDELDHRARPGKTTPVSLAGPKIGIGGGSRYFTSARSRRVTPKNSGRPSQISPEVSRAPQLAST